MIPLMRAVRFKSGDFITAAEIEADGTFPVYGGNGLRGYADRWNTEGPIAIVGRQGAHCGNVHVASTKCWVSEHALRCFPKKCYSVNFIRFALETLSLNQYSVSAAQPGLSTDNLKPLQIPFPPLETQARIAAFLDEKTARIDALIARKRALLERLVEKRQAIITQAVTKGLDPAAPMKDSGIDWLGQIPAHWEQGNIRRFATMKTGHTPSRAVPEYWDDCTIPWFTLSDVWQLRDGKRIYIEGTAENISELGLANSAAELLPAGTVIFSRTASIGFSGIMPCAMATTQDFWNWVCGPKLIPEYLLLLFRAMTQKFAEITNGSTHKTIYQPIAAGLEICVPSRDEQETIAESVTDTMKRADIARAQVAASIERLTEYRSAIVTAAVTGKLEVLNGH